MAVVGRIARPHGIRGQVVVNLETDFPHERFQPGAEFFAKRSVAGVAETPDVQRLVIATVRFHNERPIIGFEGVGDMNAAIALAGSELRIPVEQLAVLPPGMFYRHDLVGCVVDTTDGSSIGTVTDVEGTLGGSRLVVTTSRGEVLVPVAAEICRSIDIAGKRIVIEPPEGLLDLNV
ncbi:MAG TPA: ribosome maturation factor RimM [Vicinamibacterales bacterium]